MDLDNGQTQPSEGLVQENNKPPDHLGNNKKSILIYVVVFILAVLIITAAVLWFIGSKNSGSTETKDSSARQTATATLGTQLDPNKNYGNKYADGILPVGDNKYVTDSPKKGYVYVCSNYARNLQTDPGGANVRGPWFSSDGQTWDINKKVNVSGNVQWSGKFTNKVSGDKRVITTNDLPLNHTTGIFPISSSDPAYQYDRNPNTISPQSLTYSIDPSPVYSSAPNCIGGTVGIMLSGVQLFSAFDAGGRDAGAWETQDSCQGHPQQQGAYHYHTLSSCIKDTSVSSVIGFALDGFPITGPKVGTGNILTTADLDECHGLTSQISLNGKQVNSYHYVMTEDFPYSISCYRATPIQPPGLDAQQNAQKQGQIPNRQPIGQKPPLH